MNSRLRILYLEDDVLDARLVCEALKGDGVDADVKVVNSRDAFQSVLANGVDLVLADYHLPGFTGLHALAMCRGLHPEKPFIFVTGALSPERAVETLKCGATDFILKDRLSRLGPAVRRAIAESEEHRRRQHAEKALREREAQLQTTVDQLTEGVIVSNPEGELLHWNRAAVEMHGFTGASCGGRVGELAKLIELSTLGGTVLPLDQWPFSRVLRGEDLRGLELRIRRIGTDWQRVFRYGGSLARDPLGKPLLAAITVSDVTERKDSEDRLRQLNERLQVLLDERTALAEQRAAQLRRMAEELAHAEQRERENLAQILHDHLQALLVGGRLRVHTLPQARDDVERAREVKAIYDILTQAIDCSRTLSVQISPPILKTEGLYAALEWLQHGMRQNYAFHTTLDLDRKAEPRDETTRLLCFQAVRELLLNVVKHAGVRRARVEMKAVDDGKTMIAVVDGGKGFDPEVLRSAARMGQGFGLGNIQQRLDMIGGRLEIKSLPRKGTHAAIIVSAKLPANGETKPKISDAIADPGTLSSPASRGKRRMRAIPLAKAPEASASHRIRVLVADDHGLVRQGLVTTLRLHSDFEIVAEAEDGQIAVQLARRFRPDLIIMDVSMPGLDGIQATSMITREMPQSAVIGLSMHDNPDVAEQMRAAGAVAHLSKAAPPQQVIKAIRREFAAWRASQSRVDSAILPRPIPAEPALPG